MVLLEGEELGFMYKPSNMYYVVFAVILRMLPFFFVSFFVLNLLTYSILDDKECRQIV